MLLAVIFLMRFSHEIMSSYLRQFCVASHVDFDLAARYLVQLLFLCNISMHSFAKTTKPDREIRYKWGYLIQSHLANQRGSHWIQ